MPVLYFGRPVTHPREYGSAGLTRVMDKWGRAQVASAVLIDRARNEEIHKFLSQKGWVE